MIYSKEELGTFQFDRYAPVDCGFDFDATQSAFDERGQRIVIGWMDMWGSEMPTRESAISVPFRNGVSVKR